MRPVKDLWGQLVEKRLWPVALVLVLALVAVPLVLARSPPPEDPGAAAAAAAGGPPVAAVAAAADLREPGEAVVSVAEEFAGAPLRGRAKNPFLQQHVPRGAEAGGIVLVPSPEGGPPLSDGPVPAPEGTGGEPDGTDEQPPARTYVYASIDVRFGRAGAPLREIRDVPRLTPLPSASTPIVIFLGMRGDHETALFLLSTDVHAQGDGRCVPSVALCEAIELREGQIAFLDVRAEDGTVTQYELDLVDVALHETTSQSRASRSYARTSDTDRLRERVGSSSLAGRTEPQDLPAVAAAGATRSVPGTDAAAPGLTPLP